MHLKRAIVSTLIGTVLLAATVSSASSRPYYHYHARGLVPGVFGAAAAIVAGVATIATAPIALLTGTGPEAYPGPFYGYRPGYRSPAYSYYNHPLAAYATPSVRGYPPANYYRRPYYRPRPYGYAYGPRYYPY